MSIAEYRGIASGEVAILGNGPSLMQQIPMLGDVDTIGINASLQHHPSKWHCAMDQESLIQLPEMKYEADVLFTTNLLYRLPKTNTKQVSMPTRHMDIGWSKDLTDCIYSGKATIWFALQIAAWLGYQDIYLMGFDLSGKRVGGHLREDQDIPHSAIKRQLELMGYLRGLIDTNYIKQRVYICTLDNPCVTIPKVVWQHREFTKTGVYEPAIDVDITITRRPSRMGGGVRFCEL